RAAARVRSHSACQPSGALTEAEAALAPAAGGAAFVLAAGWLGRDAPDWAPGAHARPLANTRSRRLRSIHRIALTPSQGRGCHRRDPPIARDPAAGRRAPPGGAHYSTPRRGARALATGLSCWPPVLATTA